MEAECGKERSGGGRETVRVTLLSRHTGWCSLAELRFAAAFISSSTFSQSIEAESHHPHTHTQTHNTLQSKLLVLNEH